MAPKEVSYTIHSIAPTTATKALSLVDGQGKQNYTGKAENKKGKRIRDYRNTRPNKKKSYRGYSQLEKCTEKSLRSLLHVVG